ncbi:histone-lysine N-methyltransferase SETMAR [Trichonephila inaurata madagascariensis]|uniref:Histone-lysine N-methyltransferase SETMAR n=1 Tax=Trichonephila inaurata madagascariensis TaxID=2747483 RepID=A0A8X6MKT8_9ARAC|nr:histone-lysine N-methyltransferase SETMAR [Trichonephila inaurata madagascariensis]
MDVSKELVRGCLLYDFKVDLSAAASSRRICQAFGDSAVNKRTERHWFRKFRSRGLSLCDKARTGRPQALDDEALQAAIEDSSQTCSELARQFITSSETVRHHVHRLGKTYRLNYHLFHSLDNHFRGKSFPYEADVHQALTDFFASHAPDFYRKGIEQLETRWQKVLDEDGDYFED